MRNVPRQNGYEEKEDGGGGGKEDGCGIEEEGGGGGDIRDETIGRRKAEQERKCFPQIVSDV